MYSRLKLAQKYLQYYFSASNGKGHGTHSPFVYDFIRNVLNDRTSYPAYAQVEALRGRLLRDSTLLDVEDLGAGSAVDGNRQRLVSDIARHAAKSRKLGQLLYRIVRYYQPEKVLELGTSLGLSAAYLGMAAKEYDPSGRIWTIEGAPAIAAKAEQHLGDLGISNIEVIRGNFDDKMELVLDQAGAVDLAFVDGNHRLRPTLRYFHMLMSRTPRSCILIFDDIHWSEEMEEAWDAIRRDPRVYMTIDLFFIGLVILRDEFKVKQEFVIRY